MTLEGAPLACSIIPRLGYLTGKAPGYAWNAGDSCFMPNVEPNQIEHLKQMLVEYHSHHAKEWGPIPTCKEAICVEVKLALEYLVEKHSVHTDLRGFQDR